MDFCTLPSTITNWHENKKYRTSMKQKIIILSFFLFAVMSLQSQTLSAVGAGIPSTYGIFDGTTTYNNEIYAADNVQIYKWNGTNWISLGITVDQAIICMTVCNGELYVGGWFTTFNGNSVNRIVRFNGTTWQPVGSGILVANNVTGGVEKMIDYNGKLIALGGFIQAGNVSANQIASWNGLAWASLGSGLTGGSSTPAMSVFNNDLYVFSSLSNAGGVPVHNAAKWNGTNWSAVGNGLNHWPISSTIFNNNIYVGMSIGGGSASMIEKLDGSNWTNIEQNLIDSSWRMVNDLIEFNGCLYAAGLFDTINGVTVANIARYDGNNWFAVDNGVNGFGNYFTVLNNELYLTGRFTNAGTITVNHVVKFILPPLCTTGINESIDQNDFLSIYPNPATNFIYVQKNYRNSLKSNFKIIDAIGRTVLENETIPNTINIENLKNGFYIIKFENNAKQLTKIFIKN